VVLPFRNLSNDPSQDYFADGVTDNLTTDLSRIRNAVVIARNTAFTYKDKVVDAKKIGRDLGGVLEGSVQREQTPCHSARVLFISYDPEGGAAAKSAPAPA
jgi:TolB-like protein